MRRMFEYILKIDVDLTLPKRWLSLWKRTRIVMLEELGFTVTDFIVKPSPSKRGIHAWIHLLSPKRITTQTHNMYQFLCGDDVVRVKINMNRTKYGIRKWNKLFAKILWHKPVKEPCKSCKLRKAIKRVTKVVGN